MSDGCTHEREIRVSEESDVCNGVNAVDEREDALHGQIPVRVGERGEADEGEGYVVGEDGWRRRVDREELDIQRVRGGDGDHSFRVVV